MSSIDDLKSGKNRYFKNYYNSFLKNAHPTLIVVVLCESLENKGVLSQLKAKLRAEIFEVLEDNSYEKPRLSQENLLLNELIREYLEFNHYKYSKSVFLKGNYQSKNLITYQF